VVSDRLRASPELPHLLPSQVHDRLLEEALVHGHEYGTYKTVKARFQPWRHEYGTFKTVKARFRPWRHEYGTYKTVKARFRPWLDLEEAAVHAASHVVALGALQREECCRPILRGMGVRERKGDMK